MQLNLIAANGWRPELDLNQPRNSKPLILD